MTSALRTVLGLAASCALFAGCAASPKLAEYPRREIDRPLTLPKNLATWSILGEYSQEKYRDPFTGQVYTDRYTIGPVPLKWQTSLSDDWNLIWYPIPVAVVHQLRNDDAATTGIILGYGLRISSAGYSTAGIAARYFHRQKLSREFALEFTPSLMPWFPIGDRSEWDLQAGVGFGPFWQVGETVSLSAGARAVLRRDSQTVIGGGPFGSNGLDIQTRYAWRTVFPVYLGMGWSFSRQWDLVANANYQKIGEADDYSRLDVDFEFRHYW